MLCERVMLREDTSSWWRALVGRACQEATSRALRFSLLPHAPRVTYYPLVSSYTATPGAPASMCGRRSALQCCVAHLTLQERLSIDESIVVDKMV